MAYVKRGRHPADPTGESMGDTHWPLPGYYTFEPEMNIAIDRATMTYIGRGEYRVLWGKAIQVAPSEQIVIGPEESGRTYSVFTDMELKLLYRNTTGFDYEGFNYNALLQACKNMGQQIEAFPTPEGLLHPPGWEPGQEIYRPTRTQTAPTKVKRAPPSPSPRPKAGTATGRVWDIADEVLKDMPTAGHKELKAEVIRRLPDVNPATVQVQFGKWKASTNTLTEA